MEIKTNLDVIRNTGSVSIINEKDFKYYYQELNYSRKRFKEELKVGSKLFQNSLHHWYTDEEIEEIRRKRISHGRKDNFINHNYQDFSRAINEYDLEIINDLEDINPGLIKLVETYEDLETKKLLSLELFNTYIKLKEYSFWIKERIKKLRRSINSRIGIDFNDELGITFNIRKHEFIIANELKKKGYEIKHQFRIKKENSDYYSFYDLYFPKLNLLLELDSTQFHIEENIEKRKLAEDNNFKFCSINYSTKSIKTNLKKIILEIEKCLNQ